MAVFIRKQKSEILRQALRKLETQTPITAIGPGSVARAFAESVTTEIGDMYDALDFQVAQSVITTASGRALDLLGELYDVKRRTISEIAAIDKKVGAFYFYIDSPSNNPITIPTGTKIYTSADSFVGRQLSYVTTEPATIVAGQTRAYASIRPDFGDPIFTAAANTLIVHDFVSPPGVLVRCINPKPIAAQEGYEDDDNYRLRIIKSIRVAAGGTLDALRFAALGVPGVRDAKIREQPYGLGSFEVILTPEGFNFALTTSQELQMQLEKVRPPGVRMFIKQPELVAIDVSVTVMVKSTTNDALVDVLGRRVQTAIKRYVNSLLAGETLVYNKLIQYMIDVSTDIIDVQIRRYAPNGQEVLRRNYTPDADEMLIPGRIEVSVATT